MYDRAMAATEKAGLHDRRRALLAGATGDVLEIGAGTGANLGLYPASVTSLTLAEPEEPMARRLERRRSELGAQARVVIAPAEDLPFPDGAFDTVVTTLVLCTVTDPERALAEIRRVLRPGGRLLFMEHVRADGERLARWQDRLNPIQRVIAQGCNCNRDTVANIRAAGLEAPDVERGELPKAPPWIRPLATGAALQDTAR